MEFEEVRRERQRAQLSLALAAQAAGRSLGWVYAVERGLITPGRAEADAIAALIGRPAEELFSRIRENAGAVK